MKLHAACGCGQLHLTIEANPRGTLCATAWRASDAPGDVMSNTAMTKVTVTDKSTEWKRLAVNQIAVERTKAKE